MASGWPSTSHRRRGSHGTTVAVSCRPDNPAERDLHQVGGVIDVAGILIVDDDPDILDLVEQMLTPEHEVILSTDSAGRGRGAPKS